MNENFGYNISICYRCPFLQQNCAGVCLCTKNNASIQTNAETDVCPESNFTKLSINGYTAQQQPQVLELYPNGLGTLLAKQIDLKTKGYGKIIVNKISKLLTGMSCNCDARAKCLDQLIPDVTKMKEGDWIKLSPKILKCIGAKKEDYPELLPPIEANNSLR